MAIVTNTLNTRIQSKIDTLQNWSSIYTTFKPLRGEICVFEIPTGTANNPTTVTAPVTLMKIGDGVNYLGDLPFVAGVAADVANFLKIDASTGKGWTQAGFENWIRTLVTLENFDLTDYVKNDTLNAKLEEINAELLALEQRANAYTDEQIKDLEDVYAPKGATETGIEEAKAAAATEKARAEEAERALNDRIDVARDMIGTVQEGSNLAQMIKDTQANFGSQTLTNAIAIENNTAAINTLYDNDAKTKSIRTIANEELAAQLLNENGAVDNFTTLKELATWLEKHPEDAAAMNVQISDLESGLEDLTESVGEIPSGATATNVVDYAEELVAALNIGDYAKAADLTGAINRIVELEKIDHDHDNKTVLDGITAAKVTNWDDAHSKAHVHANEAVLNGIGADKVAAWDAAQENAEAYADEKIDGLAMIATTGDIRNLQQTDGEYVVFCCGSSTIMVENITQ